MDITLQAPPVSAPTSVEVRGVIRRFGAVTALADLTLQALEHEVVCVVGPSGCGKSTLLELVCGLQAPDAGSVSGAPAVYMPQRDLLFPWLNALDNAALPLRVAGASRAAARAQAHPLFAELGLDGFERARPEALSGGMRQRVAFLRTLLSGKPNGVQILASPVHAEEAELVRGAHVERALNLLRVDFDWVVLDLSRNWSEPTVRALDLADLILLVTLMDVPTLHHTRKHLDLLARLGHTGARIRLIANRHSSVDAVTDKDVAEFLERKPDFRVPNDFPTTLAGVNRGASVAEIAPRSPLARAYNELTHALHGWFGADAPAAAEATSGSALARVRGIFRRS